MSSEVVYITCMCQQCGTSWPSSVRIEHADEAESHAFDHLCAECDAIAHDRDLVMNQLPWPNRKVRKAVAAKDPAKAEWYAFLHGERETAWEWRSAPSLRTQILGGVA